LRPVPPIRIIRPDNTRELSFWSFFLGVNLLVRFLVFSASKVMCLVGRSPAFFLGVNLLVRCLGFSAAKVICLVGRSAAQFQKVFFRCQPFSPFSGFFGVKGDLFGRAERRPISKFTCLQCEQISAGDQRNAPQKCPRVL
jgi:hypothetical protein